MPEHESVIHRIQSIHYQQTILRIKKGQRMNNTKKSLKVLFIGESWHIHMIHSKDMTVLPQVNMKKVHLVTPVSEK